MDPTRKVWPPPCPSCLSGAQRLQCQPEPPSTKPDTCLTHQRWRWRNWENIFSGQNDDENAPRTVKCESLTSLSLRWKQTKSLSFSAVSYVRERGPFWVSEAASFSGHLQHKIFISSRQLCTGETTVTVSQMKMRETQHIHIYVCRTIPPISLGTNRTGNKHDINIGSIQVMVWWEILTFSFYAIIFFQNILTFIIKEKSLFFHKGTRVIPGDRTSSLRGYISGKWDKST